jgi:magnesium and cobalt transporter
MNEDLPSPSEHGNWLERLAKSLIGTPSDRKQLIETLRNAQRQNLLDPDVLSMIEGALQVTEMQVRDIMIPRVQMETLNDTDSLGEMLPVIIESGHSRFPVVSEKKDTVVGMILAKDLLRYLVDENRSSFVLKDVLRPAVFIPESKRLNVLLNEFRRKRNHMAIVVDEYGAASGLITIEDVLEQIVGEIDDEHDVDEVENAILVQEGNRFTVKALTPLEEFNEYFGTAFDEDEFDTVAGLVTKHFGRLPGNDETVVIGRLEFKVLKADSRRVQLLEVQRV